MQQETLAFEKRPLTNAERFDLVMQNTPEVYQQFIKYAREWKAAGHKRGSADQILHRLRWETGLAAGDGSGWKLNNNLSSHFARRLLADFGDEFGSDFFCLRELRSE